MLKTPTRGATGAWLAFGALSLGIVGCSASEAQNSTSWETMEVTASAYTLAEEETKAGNVGLTAFGDQLKPSSKAVAVSRDLLEEGLTHGTKIRIEGLPGVYTVRDKMNRRWQNKIDILFAKRQKALKWGKQTIEIEYRVADAD